MLRNSVWLVVAFVATLSTDVPTGLAKEKQVDVAALLKVFSRDWPSDRADYRTAGDDSWKSYARTLRAVVDAGSAPALMTGLQHENRQVRALCARALGYLGNGCAETEGCVDALGRVLVKDTWPTARLLAADSLGAFHTPAARKLLTAAKDREKQGDVVLHIGVALRREKALGEGYKQALLTLTEADLGSATVGQPAPALSLETAAGEKFSLSTYRGKYRVVLVFLYGDG